MMVVIFLVRIFKVKTMKIARKCFTGNFSKLRFDTRSKINVGREDSGRIFSWYLHMSVINYQMSQVHCVSMGFTQTRIESHWIRRIGSSSFSLFRPERRQQ